MQTLNTIDSIDGYLAPGFAFELCIQTLYSTLHSNFAFDLDPTNSEHIYFS